ncbi:hypothetical protein ACU4GI_26225 [Cupriavidus basilensis]
MRTDLIPADGGFWARRRAVVSAVLLALAGCATTDSLQQGTGGSTFEVRGKSYDEIYRAAVRAVRSNLTLVESNKETGTIKAESRAGMSTWGEVVGVFIRPPQPGATVYVVKVQSLKRSRAQITGQDWTASVIAGTCRIPVIILLRACG